MEVIIPPTQSDFILQTPATKNDCRKTRSKTQDSCFLHITTDHDYALRPEENEKTKNGADLLSTEDYQNSPPSTYEVNLENKIDSASPPRNQEKSEDQDEEKFSQESIEGAEDVLPTLLPLSECAGNENDLSQSKIPSANLSSNKVPLNVDKLNGNETNIVKYKHILELEIPIVRKQVRLGKRHDDDNIDTHKTKHLKNDDTMLTGKNKTDLDSHKLGQNAEPHENEFTCEDCFEDFQSLELFNDHSVCHVEKQFMCKCCRLFLKDLASLKTHEATHSISFTLTCNFCFLEFSSKTDILDHYKEQHDHIYNCILYNCDYCWYKCTNTIEMNEHFIKCHKNIIQQYECPVCNVTSQRIEEYKIHFLQHINCLI